MNTHTRTKHTQKGKRKDRIIKNVSKNIHSHTQKNKKVEYTFNYRPYIWESS